MPHLPPAVADVLRSIAHVLDAVAERAGWHRPAQLVRIDALPCSPDEQVQFAVQPLPPGVHPLTVLAGYIADPACVGLGVVAEGRAYDPEAAAGRGSLGTVRVVELVARDGTRVSALRRRHGELRVEAPPPTAPAGELTQALARALGVTLVDGRPAAAVDCEVGGGSWGRGGGGDGRRGAS
jgi:hypothetical protein